MLKLPLALQGGAQEAAGALEGVLETARMLQQEDCPPRTLLQ